MIVLMPAQVFVLVLETQVLVLVLVLESQVLDNNTANISAHLVRYRFKMS